MVVDESVNLIHIFAMIRDEDSQRKLTLKEVLGRLNLNTAQAARRIGISRETLSRFLNGRNRSISFTIPQIINLKQMLEEGGLELEDLSDLPDPPK